MRPVNDSIVLSRRLRSSFSGIYAASYTALNYTLPNAILEIVDHSNGSSRHYTPAYNTNCDLSHIFEPALKLLGCKSTTSTVREDLRTNIGAMCINPGNAYLACYGSQASSDCILDAT